MSAPASVRAGRLAKEMHRLEFDPPHGVSAWCREDSVDEIDAVLQGPADSPYENGSFKLHISVPVNYPFAPPKVRFTTPIYHPNIDTGGRICLDVLKMQPQGSWKPSQNLATVLTSIYLLMAEPNPDDGLMADITKEYRENRTLFIQKAKSSTKKHACHDSSTKEDEGIAEHQAVGVCSSSSEGEEDEAEKENSSGSCSRKRQKVDTGK